MIEQCTFNVSNVVVRYNGVLMEDLRHKKHGILK